MSNSLSAMFLLCFYFYIYKMFIECAKLFGNELKGRTAVSLAKKSFFVLNFSFRRMGKF